MAQTGRSRALIIYHDDPDVCVYLHTHQDRRDR